MSLFQEVALTWDGKEFVVPSDKVMGLIEAIEDVITIEELANQAGVKRVKVARAFTAAVRYAASCADKRVDITEEAVLKTLFGGDAMEATTRVVYALLSMMIPPEHLRDVPAGAGEGGQPPVKKKAARKKGQRRGTGTSKKRTS